MRHRVSGRKLGRSEDLRRSLFRNLLSELVLRGRVKTTVAKAKTVRPLIDKLVSHAKNATLSARREILRSLPKDAAFLLIETIGPQFKSRKSGFSRIIRLGQRKGDNAEMVLLEWVEEIQKSEVKKPEKTKKVKETKEIKNRVPGKRKVVEKKK